MTLFSTTELKIRTRPPARDQRPVRQIGTGAPRIVVSSADRRAIADAVAWEALLDTIRRSSQARLDLLANRARADEMTCPWERLVACDVRCRCRGTKIVTVGFLRDHYERLALEIVMLTTPSPIGRVA